MNRAPQETSSQILPRRTVLEQPAVQEALEKLYGKTGSLDAVLRELESWSHSVGYFDHLTEENIFLSFPEKQLGVDLELQINYSRLSYQAPAGQKRTVECPLCFENIGIPGKELLRVFEFESAGVRYFAHLTPFPLHPGHFVMNTRRHEPMRVGEPGLREVASFLDRAPGWLAASNSDVEWAGASVLGHHHCQLFRDLELPLEKAEPQKSREVSEVRIEFLKWLGPVARLTGDRENVLNVAARLLAGWRDIDPEKCTANYLMRVREGGEWVVHLLFRHPGFRTPMDLRKYKSEGVGIIEVAGEVILPPLQEMTRAENRRFFEKKGAEIVCGIIAGNAPWSDEFTREFYWNLLSTLH